MIRCPNCHCSLETTTILAVPSEPVVCAEETEDHYCLACGNVFLAFSDATRCPRCDSPRVRSVIEPVLGLDY